jgi:molybdopterin-guanine dinucleotide biosynthesis protein A
MIKPFSFAVVILAGGKSLRMNGVNKAFLDINNQKLINIILCKVENLKLPVAINANQYISKFNQFNNNVIQDKNYIGLGPLSGVYTAMNWTETQSLNWVLTLPCDVPFFPNDIFFKVEEKIKNINKNIKIISFSSNKKKHPIISAWNLCLKKELKFALENGVRKVDTFVSRFKHVCLNYNFDEKSLDPFFNINSKNEIKKLENYNIN